MKSSFLFFLRLASLALVSSSGVAVAQDFYGLDFTDPGWTNDTTGLSSEFQTNGPGSGNFAGWDSTHSISDINGSGIGATLSLSHKPNAWNIESRPALEPYFPSQYGDPGDILRIWNNESNIGAGELPSLTLMFTEEISLQTLSLEGYRYDDAWMIQAFDAGGNVVAPNWADPNVAVTTDPGAPLTKAPINLLSTTGVNGATVAETTSLGRYDAGEAAFYIWNEDDVFPRGASVLDYNLDSASVKTLVYTMVEVNSTGTSVGTPADQSMYIGSGILGSEFIVPVIPEPSSMLLIAIAGLGLIARRRRA